MDETIEKTVRMCLDGQPQMFRHLVDQFEGPLLRHLMTRLSNSTEVADAAQESFVRAYFSLGDLRNREAFFPWLLGIAERVAKETIRARSRRQAQTVDLDTVLHQTDSASDSPKVPDAALDKAIAELPDLQRQVILMRFFRGQSCAEISDQLDVRLGTVTSRLSRAYALLRDALANHFSHDLDEEIKL